MESMSALLVEINYSTQIQNLIPEQVGQAFGLQNPKIVSKKMLIEALG
jgi:hypothetical protein